MLCLSNQKIHHTKSIFHIKSESFFFPRQPAPVHVNAIPLDIAAKLENQSTPSGATEHVVVMAFEDYLFFTKLKSLLQKCVL